MSVRKKYKIIIIEPSPVIQQGIKILLEKSPEFEVAHNYTDYQSFKDNWRESGFHAVLVNPAIISFHKQFSAKSFFADYPDVPVIGIIYSYVDAATLESFDGCLDIYNDGNQLIKKLRKVIEESNRDKNNYNTDNVDLSDREKEILISVAKGLTNKEIAETHNISIHTVISHRKNITRKTGIKTVSGLTIYAIFNNLISQDNL